MTDADGTVVVMPDDTLPDVIARLSDAAAAGTPVRLIVPIDSSLLLTAAEFRALKDASEEQRLPLLLRTADPLRLQLAGRIGVRAEALPRARPTAARPPAVVTMPVAPGDPDTTVDGSDWPGAPPEIELAPRLDPAAGWPDKSVPAVTEPAAPPETEPESPEETELANPPRRWLPIAIALIGLVALAYFGIRYLVPSAVIKIVPKTAAAAESVVFDVTENGQPIDKTAAFAITSEKRQIQVVWEGSAPVTGVRVEPDASATGPIELRNPGSDAVKIAAGTVVKTETGVAFAFTEDVAVPAADPSSGKPGAATGTVRAVEGGSGGNVANGELGGRLQNGVYYSNRLQPTQGGTDKQFPIVSADDLAKLSAAAKEAAPDLAAAAVKKDDPNASVLATTVSVSQQHDQFDAQVGADAKTVSVQSTLTLQFQSYDAAVAREKYEPLLLSRLSDAAPHDYAIDPKSVVFTDPVEKPAGGGAIRLQVAAKGNAVAVLDEAEKQRLAASLAGLDEQGVTAILQGAPEIESFHVDYQPVWLTNQMPANAGRIRFEVAE